MTHSSGGFFLCSIFIAMLNKHFFCLVTCCIIAGKCYRHKQIINPHFISQAEKHERKKAGFCRHIQIHTINETEFFIKFQKIPLKSPTKDFQVSPLKFNYPVSKRSNKTWPVMSIDTLPWVFSEW